MNKKIFQALVLCTILFSLCINSVLVFENVKKQTQVASYPKAIEFDDLLKYIAIPDSVDYNCHGERFLADSNTFVTWKTDGVNDFHGEPVSGGLGGLGREGTLFIHFEGKPMTKVLRKTIEETPWNISWSGTFHLVFAVYLTADVSTQDYVNIAEYIQMKKRGSKINSNSNWMKLSIPGYKTLWMNIDEDFGNSLGTIRLAFVFEAP